MIKRSAAAPLFEKHKKTFIVVGIIVGLIILFNIGGFFVNKRYHENLQKQKKGYCYQMEGDTLKPAMFVQEKNRIDALIQYYRNAEKGATTSAIKSPSLSLPLDTCVYILAYDKDSIVAEVACYYTWGKRDGYVTGYVYAATLHSVPPPDSLIKASVGKK